MSTTGPSPSRDQVRDRLVAMMCDITRRTAAEIGEVSDATPCVGGALLSDSLDVLEFVVALEREFGVSIRDGDAGHKALANLGTLTDHVVASRK
ncbi:MAG: acyl carrier protein [Planctomycetes bacterium]|nr:acyl carrier protein [Planctomycetota bacterium]